MKRTVLIYLLFFTQCAFSAVSGVAVYSQQAIKKYQIEKVQATTLSPGIYSIASFLTQDKGRLKCEIGILSENSYFKDSRTGHFSFKKINLWRLRQRQGRWGFLRGECSSPLWSPVARVSCAGEIKFRKQSRSLAAGLLKKYNFKVNEFQRNIIPGAMLTMLGVPCGLFKSTNKEIVLHYKVNSITRTINVPAKIFHKLRSQLPQ